MLKYGAARARNVCKPLEAEQPTSFLRECAFFKVIYTVEEFDGLP